MQMSVGTMPHDKIMRSIELLGTVVAPAVRSAIQPPDLHVGRSACICRAFPLIHCWSACGHCWLPVTPTRSGWRTGA